MPRPPHRGEDARADAVLLGLALTLFLLEWLPSWAGPYGYFIDEPYYLACSRHLAAGYVDHPPLSILLLRGVRAALGDSLPALRAVPALAGAATVFVTGRIARSLGAGAFGQALAAGAVVASPVMQVAFSFYSMNALALLIWALCFWILVEIERRDEPRLWLLFGLVAGLGLENKHTLVLLGLGLAVGLVITPARRHLASRWLWMGVAVAALLLLPNLLWQEAHGWPSLEFYRNADRLKNLPTAPLVVFAQQVLAANPVALPLWLSGLFFFLFGARGRPYRHLGWIYLTLLLLLLVGQKSRPDRIAAAYTVLFAGGGVALGEALRGARRRWLRASLAAALAVSGAALAAIALPLLPPAAIAGAFARVGAIPRIEAGEGKRSELPQWLADRLGWEQLTGDVRAVLETLDSAERAEAIVLGAGYGHAGPVELAIGPAGPPVYSPHNSYFLWGPPPDPVRVAIVIGFRGTGGNGEIVPREPLPRLFGRIELARVYRCRWCMSWRDQTPIWIAREPRSPFREIWPEMRFFQ